MLFSSCFMWKASIRMQRRMQRTMHTSCGEDEDLRDHLSIGKN
jgi:hypothetical protein